MKILSKLDNTGMIDEVTDKRYVTDAEKSTWNSKSDTDTITTINGKTGAITKADIVALGIPAQDTTYGTARPLYTGLMGSHLFYPHPEFERIDANRVHDATYGLTVTQSIAKLDVDKANKTQVLTDVPVGAKFTDTVYTHPASHPASMITDLPTGKKVARFVVGTSTTGWTAADCDYLCDGTADDTEINAAINALPATGGEVVILDGTYNITAKIDVTKNNVSIRGNGNATILKRMFNSSIQEGIITLTSRSGCKVVNLQIEGNKTNYTNSNNYGIYLTDSSDNAISGNTCNNNHIYGMYLANSSDNAVTGNSCNNNNVYGMFLTNSSSNAITGNTCNTNTYGIYLTESSNNAVTANACNNNIENGIYLIDSSSNNTVTSNACNNNDYGNGIHLFNSSSNTVTSNTCNNNYNGIGLISSNENTITGNTCNNNENYAIFLNSSSNENTIAGNTCNNSHAGFGLISSSNNTITGNTFKNNNTHGIYLDFSSNNNITGNTCIRGTGLATDYASFQHTIQLRDSNNSYNLISNNNCMGKAPLIGGGTGNSVYGNKYDSGDYKDFTQDEKTKLSGIAASANNYTHPTTAGNKHIPTGGASGQVLKYSTSGTATWQADSDTITTINGKTGAISKADITALGIPAQDTVYTHPTTHSISEVSGLQTALDGKVDDSQVLTNVPLNAKFTDTITTINGKTGTIAKADIVALGIPAQDTVYTHPPGTNPHGTTKSDVGLNNVTNDKQMPISGGVLENYTEKITTVSSLAGNIYLNQGNVFVHTPSGSRTYSIHDTVSDQAHSFTLIINMGSTVRTLTFPSSVKWQGGEIPDMSAANKTYVLTFMTVDGGTNWLGMFGGEF